MTQVKNTTMKRTDYQWAKLQLKRVAKEIKESHPTDKPMQRMVINGEVDACCKDLGLSEYQRNLLSLYACTLHPKD